MAANFLSRISNLLTAKRYHGFIKTEEVVLGTHLEAAANVAQRSPAILPFGPDQFVLDRATAAGGAEIGMIAPGVSADAVVKAEAGMMRVGDLRAGDKVMTRDNGLQPLIWVGQQHIPQAELQTKPWLCPVAIAPHALKPDLPETELMVSQQFLVLVRSRIAQRMVGAPEVLVPANQLCQVEGIQIAKEVPEICYVTLLFASHQILSVNGVESGSLHLDAATITGLSDGLRAELLGMVAETPRPVSARMILEGRMGRRLADRHRRNDKRLIA